MTARALAAVCAIRALVAGAPAGAEDPPGAAIGPAEAPPIFAWHWQATFTEQGHPPFPSPYRGPNSLSPDAEGRETADVTLFLGAHPWAGGEIWANAEIDQGFGLNNTLGVAAFPSAEAYKVGEPYPYLKLPRLFLRQTIGLGGASGDLDPGPNQFAQKERADRLVLTVGKFGVNDVFDANPYAHDPRADFMNWALIDAGTFDYAANAWGFTYGATAELYVGAWTARAGLFDLSSVPNSIDLDPKFDQFQMIGEIEHRHQIAGRAGALRVTVFDTRGRMARFADAIALGEARGGPPDLVGARRYQGRGGVSFSLDQALGAQLGLFVRGGLADGNLEPYEYTDIDNTLSGGLSLRGAAWGRKDDVVALAGVTDGVSRIHQQFLNDGGLGILIGDGRLPHPGRENVVETFYDAAAGRIVRVTFDLQLIDNPGYNRDRGPATILTLRLHAGF